MVAVSPKHNTSSATRSSSPAARKEHLGATTKANPGMDSVELDISEPANIAAVANKLVADYPALNVLINNAGSMQIDDAAGKIDDQLLTSTSHDELVGADPSDVGLDRAPEEAAKSGRYLQHLGAGVCSPRLNRGLFVHEGGPAFVRPFAALQTQGHFSQRSGNCSAVGPNGSSK